MWFTVPAEYVAVVRDIEVQNLGSGADSLEVDTTVPGPLEVPIARFNGIAQNDHVQWTGRVVLTAGQEIVTATLGNTWSVIISGYLLSSS